MSYTYKARFVPQAWINDNAIEIDHNGTPDTWDCTKAVLSDSWFHDAINEQIEIRTNDNPLFDGEVLDDNDWLKSDPDAPEWVRHHQGPFSIWVSREEIQ